MVRPLREGNRAPLLSARERATGRSRLGALRRLTRLAIKLVTCGLVTCGRVPDPNRSERLAMHSADCCPLRRE